MARTTPFTIITAFRGGVAALAVRGDADIATAPGLEATYPTPGPPRTAVTAVRAGSA